jgi:DNA polymerase-3 subunit alpha
MQIARQIASYSLGDANLLRLALTTKNLETMVAEKEKFIIGAGKNRISREHAAALFDQLAEFTKFGANKAHCIAYALSDYQAAYLKTHFHRQYMAALSSCQDASRQLINDFSKV